MKNKKFFNIDHAHLYLAGSTIRVDGLPVYVRGITYNSVVRRQILVYAPVENYDERKADKISLNSARVDMNPIPLGFINFQEFGKPKIAIGAYRIPSRQWRIGLTTDNMRIVPHRFDEYERKKKIIHSIHFKNSVCGKFPKIAEIIEMIKSKEATSQAFSRDFAIEKNKLKFIQLKPPVGKLFKGEPMLFDDYLYLGQLLEKAL